ASIALLIAGRPILTNARAAYRRGHLDRDGIALAAAVIAFFAGTLEIVFAARGAPLPTALAWLGFRPEAWRAQRGWGLEAAAAIVVVTLLARRAAIALRDAA